MNGIELTLTVRMSRCYHSLCERWFLKLNFAYRQNLATHGQADHEPTIRPSWIQRLMLAVV